MAAKRRTGVGVVGEDVAHPHLPEDLVSQCVLWLFTAGREEAAAAAELICACISGRFRQTSVGAVTARRRNALPVFPRDLPPDCHRLDLRCRVRCPCAASMQLVSGGVTGSTRGSQFLTSGSTPTSAGIFPFFFLFKLFLLTC